ncbi:hypothetical protein CASFOL_040766 [Castilleja foliolosa]|uniref:RRM domain-containing protein n=1 Tax=Castilleja foliolosa TaxID=1961234 RepID=A0ABD3BCK0_9LAMI
MANTWDAHTNNHRGESSYLDNGFQPNWGNYMARPRRDPPKSDGSEPLTWLYKARKYFEFYGTSPDERLRLVASMLEGPAADWFRWRMSSGLIDDWDDFERKFKQRFDPLYYVDYFDRLKMLKPPREEEPSRILVVSIHNMLYPMTEEVLHQVFDPHGVVDKIIILQKSAGFQALIRYQSHESAISARDSLHGRDIYDSCCRLDIQFSDLDKLQVNFNDERAHDIIIPTAAVEYKTENRHIDHSDEVKNLSTDTAHMKDVIVDVSDTGDPVPQTKQVEVPEMVEDTELVEELVELVELEECDASILVDDIASLEVEKGVAANINSVETVDRMNKVVEKECKGVVPCAQIFDLAASDLGERDWSVKLGNLDFIFFLGVRDQSEKRRKRDAIKASLTYFLSYTLRTRWFFKRGRMLWIRGRGPKSGRRAKMGSKESKAVYLAIQLYYLVWLFNCLLFIIVYYLLFNLLGFDVFRL